MLICIFICIHLPLKLPALELLGVCWDWEFLLFQLLMQEEKLRPERDRDLSVAQ